MTNDTGPFLLFHGLSGCNCLLNNFSSILLDPRSDSGSLWNEGGEGTTNGSDVSYESNGG